jgi:hypothetical protein
MKTRYITINKILMAVITSSNKETDLLLHSLIGNISDKEIGEFLDLEIFDGVDIEPYFKKLKAFQKNYNTLDVEIENVMFIGDSDGVNFVEYKNNLFEGSVEV